MNEKLLKPYNPKETEDQIYKLWEESGFFNPDNLPKRKKETFTITLPPPNVTGSLHMGHALNATIQDILIRKKRMEGYKTLWLPGTDHAGIATQNVVEKQLKKEGLNRHDLGREKFLERVWQWKEEYGNKILGQLKKIGASCDWSRTRFTMDEDYSLAVKKAFEHYHKNDLIYQGERVINWCTKDQTALSDLELEYEEEKGNLYYIKYPLKNDPSQHVTVATTRPETMLGDTAVAVNPKDEKYKNFIGKTLILPIVNREIPIITDSAVDKEFGTGAVKVTPSHSIIDSEIAKRHNLPGIVIINKYGKMTKGAGEEFEGLSTRNARESVIQKLEKLEALEKTEEYTHRVSKCYRCNSTIEPQPSKQWFLRMKELAENAKEAVIDGSIKFNDGRWKKIYMDWLENIHDWCISRQIWWGHKIPLEGVDDVLDTWFSSALWPFATLGWPNKNKKDLQEFYPTQVLSTDRGIINLWVARMVFSGLEFMGEKPFSDVLIHPTVLAKDGRRMSKSLGTGINPLDLIKKYGADATRFGIIYQTMGGQDIRFNESQLIAGKKFANKLWNIARFILSKTTGEIDIEIRKSDIKTDKESEDLIKKLEEVIKKVSENIEYFDFGQALHILYDFVWHEFADKYLEYSKTKEDEEVRQMLSYTLVVILKLLHPFMPFITEEIWQLIHENTKTRKHENTNLLMVEEWPSKN